MSEQNATPRRGYGAGRLYTRTYADGSQGWYGIWWAGQRRVKRKLGPKRAPGSRAGLTRSQAEAELRREMSEARTFAAAMAGERLTVAELGERYRRHLEAAGRKPSTTRSVESCCRVWLEPHLGERTLDAVTAEDVEDLRATMLAAGLSAEVSQPRRHARRDVPPRAAPTPALGGHEPGRRRRVAAPGNARTRFAS